jgi:hypothetical protein
MAIFVLGETTKLTLKMSGFGELGWQGLSCIVTKIGFVVLYVRIRDFSSW